MNEAAWLASEDPAAMLEHILADGQHPRSGVIDAGTGRRLRLFAVACCRSANPHGKSLSYGEEGEKITDPAGTALGWCRAHTEAWGDRLPHALRAHLLRDICGNPFRRYARTAIHDCSPSGHGLQFLDEAWRTPTVLRLAGAAYRDRPGRECGRCGGTGEVRKGVMGQWEDPCPDCRGSGRIDDGALDADLLAVLADALEEGGCTEEAVLRHLRGEELAPMAHMPHLAWWRPKRGPCVRGCAILDLILGES